MKILHTINTKGYFSVIIRHNGLTFRSTYEQTLNVVVLRLLNQSNRWDIIEEFIFSSTSFDEFVLDTTKTILGKYPYIREEVESLYNHITPTSIIEIVIHREKHYRLYLNIVDEVINERNYQFLIQKEIEEHEWKDYITVDEILCDIEFPNSIDINKGKVLIEISKQFIIENL